MLVWLFFSYYFGFNSENDNYVFWFSSIILPITIINTYFFIYFLIPKYLLTKVYKKFMLFSVYTFIGTAYLLSIIMFFGYVYMSELDFRKMPILSRSLPFTLLSIYTIVIIVSAFKLVKYNYVSLEKNKTLENKFLQSQLQLKEEELKFLKMQIHPHFLFNTLNTLYGYALKKSNETPTMILKLSNLLDYILYQIDKPKVLLIEEINHIKDYISLEKNRFNDTLSVTLTVEKLNSFHIAPMILMPFVENSFKHGDLINGILDIKIDIKTNGNTLDFYIVNSVLHNNSTAKGIGLKNIKKRLEMLYPNKHQLTINKSNQIFEVKLKITIDE